MNTDIKTKIVGLTAGIMFLSIGATILTSAHVFTKEYTGSLQSRSLAIGKGLKLQLGRLFQLGLTLEGIIGFDEQCRDIVEKYDGIKYANVTDLDGRILFHSDPSMQGKTTTDAAVLQAVRNPSDNVTVFMVDKIRHYDAVIPVFDTSGQHIAAVRIGVPASLIATKTRRMGLYATAVGLVFLGGAMGSLLLALNSLVTKPLAKLLAVIAEMREKGSAYAGKVEIDSRDEIGRLASAFNSMTEDLKVSTVTRKELELEVAVRTRQLLEAQEELVRKEKLSILGQLSGSVGHELRNPLGVMSNAVYYLKMVHADGDETTREYLDMIKQEIDNSLRIITDLLDFARTRTPLTRKVPVRELLDETLVKCAIPKNVELNTDLPDNLPLLRIDPLQMGQVLQNLITNAIQAMPDGGAIRIAARQSDTDFIEISVADTGEGITPGNMKKLFQPLFTTKAKGIGLGLVVCKNLTEANGGRIEVESESGAGATFTLLLPAGE